MPTIKIDNAYWQTVKKDYSDWRFAWGREAGQNSLDAGSDRIDITVAGNDGVTTVIWADNGRGMSKDVALNKFLALGGSFKASGNTGGFGIAKSILAFAQKSYRIRSGDFEIIGEGSEYEIVEDLPNLRGVTLTVEMESDDWVIIDKITNWVAWTTTDAVITLNGNRLKSLKLPANPREELPWAKIYVHRKDDGEFEYKTRVRINGQFMFSIWSDCQRHVTIDIIDTDSSAYLTANRDGMNYYYSDKLTKIIAQIFQDPNKIRNTDVDDIVVYTGSLGKVYLGQKVPDRFSETSTPEPSMANMLAAFESASKYGLGFEAISATRPGGTYSEETARVINGHSLAIVNNLSIEIDDKWKPGTLSEHASRLMNKWIAVLKFCAPLCNVSQSVQVGWVFNLNNIAENRLSNQYGCMILLNPTVQSGNALKQRWNNTRTSFYELVSTAIHELTHCNNYYHDANFANSFTDNVARVFLHTNELEELRKSL